MKAVAKGDQSAFTALFRRYKHPLFQFACRLTASVDVGEDLTQECFVRVLRSAKAFDRSRGSLRVYLYATMRNLALTLIEKQSRERTETRSLNNVNRREIGIDADTDILSEANGPEELLLDREASSVVRRAIRRLPYAQREALILVQYNGLSLEEAAQVLRIDVGAVKSRVHRARAKLKDDLAPYFTCRRPFPKAEGL